MRHFSLRTLLLVTMGVSVLCGLFATAGWHPSVAHLLLVLAFAAPAGSLGHLTAGTRAGASSSGRVSVQSQGEAVKKS